MTGVRLRFKDDLLLFHGHRLHADTLLLRGRRTRLKYGVGVIAVLVLGRGGCRHEIPERERALALRVHLTLLLAQGLQLTLCQLCFLLDARAIRRRTARRGCCWTFPRELRSRFLRSGAIILRIFQSEARAKMDRFGLLGVLGTNCWTVRDSLCTAQIILLELELF